ncbi:MAG TPA: hypothetical protein VGO50_13935 [Pyrinomonadaceae bacterium]|jgi:hypothetical protein|nr:hypothetical protein [Pyrinomonadaceae bacterium]
MKKIDMSSEAITRRIKQTDQLREVSLSLMKAKKLTPEESMALKAKRAEKTVGETPDGQ